MLICRLCLSKKPISMWIYLACKFCDVPVSPSEPSSIHSWSVVYFFTQAANISQ